MFGILFWKLWSLKTNFDQLISKGPGSFETVREGCRTHSVEIRAKADFMMPSYDKNMTLLSEEKNTKHTVSKATRITYERKARTDEVQESLRERQYG